MSVSLALTRVLFLFVFYLLSHCLKALRRDFDQCFGLGWMIDRRVENVPVEGRVFPDMHVDLCYCC